MDQKLFCNTIEDIYAPLIGFEKHSLPLCAAENVTSDFVKTPLTSFLQEKYIMGGILKYDSANNFIGSDKIYAIYRFLNSTCVDLFRCTYADGRTFSGVNAVMILLMSIFKHGDTILISNEDCGGHSSMPKLCKRLGIHVMDLPYDYNSLDIDYEQLNIILQKEKIDGILICLSDILYQPNLEKINLPLNTKLIYDATQVLGLIASGAMPNHFDHFKDNHGFIMLAATHKTLPGPANGLIMTRNEKIAQKIDTLINPDYLRNVHLHQILSLIFALQELSVFGKEYSNLIINNANILGHKLEQAGFDVIKRNNVFTNTHQLMIAMNKDDTDAFYKKCINYGITLNARYKKIYSGSGIRLGVQEVSRFGWGETEIENISDILSDIMHEVHTKSKHDSAFIKNKIKDLAGLKKVKFTFSPEEYESVARLFT